MECQLLFLLQVSHPFPLQDDKSPLDPIARATEGTDLPDGTNGSSLQHAGPVNALPPIPIHSRPSNPPFPIPSRPRPCPPLLAVQPVSHTLPPPLSRRGDTSNAQKRASSHMHVQRETRATDHPARQADNAVSLALVGLSDQAEGAMRWACLA